jgi:hypothetical protein
MLHRIRGQTEPPWYLSLREQGSGCFLAAAETQVARHRPKYSTPCLTGKYYTLHGNMRILVSHGEEICSLLVPVEEKRKMPRNDRPEAGTFFSTSPEARIDMRARKRSSKLPQRHQNGIISSIKGRRAKNRTPVERRRARVDDGNSEKYKKRYQMQNILSHVRFQP